MSEEKIAKFNEFIENKKYNFILNQFSLEEREQIYELILEEKFKIDFMILFKIKLFTSGEAK